ncbi:solute carrier family 28 member 3-like [Elysia marginata]|uniref:Solute carrier family 28 member 3-like n=1 Tax=Elysia marginata TaxID=1093978 RepID=A0AAV4IP91_9GAST|nr:solute carrier family 28 member 3-like [Elysia marginata]
MDTSPVESMSVAAGMFLEGVTAILCLRPYLPKMSKSQLFLVISSAFASLGGAYLAILSSMGVPLTFLIPAMVVSAPATFAVCKLIVPETKIKRGGAMKYKGPLEAAQTGAISMVPLITNIIVVVFVFITYIAWMNHTLQWFGERVGVDGFTIEKLSAYIFYPMALAMGIEPNDCFRSGMLLGYRLVVNNLVAFLKLAEMHHNRDMYQEYMHATNWTGPVLNSDTDIILQAWNKTLRSGFISVRSEAVVTYSLCGFSSGMTVMIMMGIMATLLPRRTSWIMRMSLPALIAGNIANCMTGCFAGIFYEA